MATPVLLPGKSHGQRSLVGYSPWGHKSMTGLNDSTTTKPQYSYQSEPISSVQFSHSVRSDSLQPHESQHTRPPCPSPTPGVYSNSCPSSRWCHPAISPSVVLFSSCPQSLPASGSFPMSQRFAWGGQSTGVSSFSIRPSSEHSGLISFRMDWLDLLAVPILLPKWAHSKNLLKCSRHILGKGT